MMVGRRGCVILAALLWSEAGRAQESEFPIGAWFPGLFQADSKADWEARLDLVVADHFNTIHASLTGIRGRSGISAARNDGWMDVAEDKNLNIQLHSWWQPPQWKNHSRQYWARTFEVEEAGLFTSPIGARQVTEADGRVAWYAEVKDGDEGHDPGLLLDTPSTSGSGFELRSNAKAKSRPLDERHTRHVFWLKTDDNTGTPTLWPL